VTRFLLATHSVHASAAGCDYLAERAGPEDEVIVVAVREGETDRDAGDAANVAAVRLVEPDVRTLTREGDPAREILGVATAEEVDEILVGPHGGTPDEERLGETARDVATSASVPVVVVPLA